MVTEVRNLLASLAIAGALLAIPGCQLPIPGSPLPEHEESLPDSHGEVETDGPADLRVPKFDD